MTIEELSEKIYQCYSKELCYPKVKEIWNNNNKYLGMCAITSLIVNDYFYGDICKIYVDGISHYFNFINEKIIDLTSRQFKREIDYSNYKIVNRMDMLTEDTYHRYNLLQKRLKEKLDS